MTRAKMKRYKSYRFQLRDPVLPKILTIMDNSGLTKAEISRESGVAVGTFGNWKDKTRKPQFCTVEAAARVCGKTLVFADRH